MQKRLLLSFTMIALFMVFWSMLGQKLGYAPSSSAPEVETSDTEIATNEAVTNESKYEPAEIAAASGEVPTEPVVEVALVTTVLENDHLRLKLDNEGGVIREASLSTYFRSIKKENNVNLVFAFDHFPGQLLFADDKGVPRRYEVEQPDNHTVVYRHKAGNREIVKSYSLKDGFKLRYEVKVSDGSGFMMIVGEGLESVAPGEKLTPSLLSMGAINPKMMYFAWSEDGDHETENVGKQSRDSFEPLLEEDATIAWLGVKDNYFANVFLPDEPIRNGLASVKDVFLIGGEDPISLPIMAMKAEGSLSGSFYLGPIEESELLAADERLVNLITYGWAGMLSKWLFSGLNWFHGQTGNWGWSIILLTMALRLMLVPVTAPQMKSSLRMRKLQPKIEKLRQKFGGDDLESKQKLSQATFKLYKEEGVNPFSSCITGLAQMPILFAYFSLLRSSFYLRQADWMGWVQDLSIKDGTFILPVAMGVTMFLSTMAMPMPSTDPAQAKMMKFMPVMISLMFVFMPSGLILYMITSNIFTLIQNTILKWRYADK